MFPVGPVEGAGFKAPGKPSGDAANRGSGLRVLSTYPVSTAAKRPHTRWGAGAGTEAFTRWNSDFSEDDSAVIPVHALVMWRGNTVVTLSECGTKHVGVY